MHKRRLRARALSWYVPVADNITSGIVQTANLLRLDDDDFDI